MPGACPAMSCWCRWEINNSGSKSFLAQRRGSTIVPVAEHEEMILTDAQYQAFQEAFELFDKNGGGTIDAAELQKTLDDCGIYVNGDDLGKFVTSLMNDT